MGRLAVDDLAADTATLRKRAPMRMGRAALGDPHALAAAALTLIALGLRIPGISQSVVGDELFLYEIARRDDLFDVLRVVQDTESTPPLHFVIAWAAAKLGDPLVWIRIPSLILGTLTVPLTYALGVRTVGRTAALLGAAFVTVAPLAIFYSDDARAYAVLAFLCGLSTMLLLHALDDGRRGSWVAFAACCTAALYVHYIAIFVVVAQGGWTVWARRDRLSALLYAYAGIALAYVPWLPSFLIQRRDSTADRIETLYPLDAESALLGLLQAFPGLHFVPLREVPGQAALGLLAAAVLAAAAVALVRKRDDGRAPRRRTLLVVLLAAATPLGALVYSFGPESVFWARNLIPSLPFACLALGALFAQLDRRLLAPVAALAIAAVSVGAVRTLEPDLQRAPYEQVADYLDREVRPGDTVLEAVLAPGAPSRALTNYLDPETDVFVVMLGEPGENPHAGPRSRLFVVAPRFGRFSAGGRARPPAGFRPLDEVRFHGTPPITVRSYRPLRP